MQDVEVKEAASRQLTACDFTDVLAAKKASHYPGTREWVFDAVRSWLETGDRLFWLVGGAGTGKSVASAKLFDVDDIKNQIVAWHFCQHNNASNSELRVILESLSAMLQRNLPGFKVSDVNAALFGPTEEMFERLIAAPLTRVKAPTKPAVIILDALDELPAESLRPVLTLLSDAIQSLPPFIRIYVTSRDEAVIKAQLQKFAPLELKVDEIRNREDLRAYLVQVARQHVKMELTLSDMEAKLEREFELAAGSLEGKLCELEEPIRKSKHTYDVVIQKLMTQAQYRDLLNIPDIKSSDQQSTEDLDVLYEDAKLAREILLRTFASAWRQLKVIGKTILSIPVEGKASPWVDSVIDPGLKEKSSAMRKVRDEYGGHPRLLKDLARLTAECHNCGRMADMLDRLKKDSNFRIVGFRNKYANPTPLGYRDFNLTLKVTVAEGRGHLCETQVNLQDMLVAKELAHAYYEVIREALPKICLESGIAEDKRSQFESSVMRMLQNSVLDSVVHELESKSNGLFIYAAMVAQQLAEEKDELMNISTLLRQLPSGLGEIYESNFKRMCERMEWDQLRRVVAMICVTREPLPTKLVQRIIGVGFDQIVEALSVLFPVREGRFEVMHKSVVDWLRDTSRVGQSYNLDMEDVTEAHRELANEFLTISQNNLHHNNHDTEASYALRHVVFHFCEAQQGTQVHDLVCTFEFLFIRSKHPADLIEDVVRLNNVAPLRTLKLLTDALNLALGALNQDQRYFPGQLVGRLLCQEAQCSGVQKLLASARKWPGADQRGWWCPMSQTLEPAGGNIQSIIVEAEIVVAVAWSPDGKYLCSGTQGYCGALRVWDVASNKCVVTFRLKSRLRANQVCSVAWSESDKLCSGDRTGEISLWDVESGQCLKRMKHPEAMEILSLAWDGLGSRVCHGSNRSTVGVWDVDRGGCLLKISQEAIVAVAWSKDGQKICGGGLGGILFVWDLQGTVLQQLNPVSLGVTTSLCSVVWSPGNSHVCTVYQSGVRQPGTTSMSQLYIWDLNKAAVVQTLAGHPDNKYPFSTCLSWHTDGRLVSGGGEVICVWDTVEAKCLREMTSPSGILSVNWNCKGQVASGSRDKTIRTWDVTAVGTQAIQGHLGRINVVAWHDKRLCTGGSDNTVRVWDTTTGELLKTLNHTGEVVAVTWTSDGRVISGDSAGLLAVWDITTGEHIKLFLENPQETYGCVLVWSKTGQICGSRETNVHVWDPEDGKCLLTFTGHQNCVVNAVGCNTNGKVCSVSPVHVFVWAIETGEILQNLPFDNGFSPKSVAWINESQVCVTSCASLWITEKCTFCVWDVISGQPIPNAFPVYPLGTFFPLTNKQPTSFDDILVCECPFNSELAVAQLRSEKAKIHFLRLLGTSPAMLSE